MTSVQGAIVGCVGTLTAVAALVLVTQPGAWPPPPAQATSAVLGTNAQAHTDIGGQLSASACGGVGAAIVSVTERIKNDADSGSTGNYWGLDDFNRTIEVWKAKPGTYCAVVRYEGSFRAIAGQTSPGGTGTLTGNEIGRVTGGYIATITGTLMSDSVWPTKGAIGTVDYQCDKTGACPGISNWLDQYFESGYTFEQPVWGWIYNATSGKVWANLYTGSVGDIL